MYDYHVVLATVAVIFGLIGSVIYIRSIVRGDTKPHIFTWLSFAVIDTIIFVVQFMYGGGPGVWVTFASIVWIFVICTLSLWWGEKHITTSDWIAFSAALIGIVLWVVTKEPLPAVVILTATNTLAVVPTFRKSYVRPYEESVSLWSLDIAKFSLGIFALSSITATTALFPAGIVATNAAVVGMILLRRRAVDRKTASGSV